MKRLLAHGLCFRYGRCEVLRDVSLSAQAGKATVLVGPNGCGKTSLLWLLAGLLRPAAGTIELVEDDSSTGADAGQPARSTAEPLRVGMVFQQSALWDHLTARKHLELVLSGLALPAEQRRSRIERTLQQMRLEDLADRRPGQMSGGQRQRLAMARALVIRPPWLLLDEPLAHLDGPIRAEMFDLLRGVLAESGAGVILATHEPAEALRLADQIVLLLQGSLAQAGPAEEVYRHPVSLAAARVLGPACELAGQASRGLLTCDGQTILAGLNAGLTGPARVILRPEDLTFQSDPAGATVVSGSDLAVGGWLVRASAGGQGVIAFSDRPWPAGTRGLLRKKR